MADSPDNSIYQLDRHLTPDQVIDELADIPRRVQTLLTPTPPAERLSRAPGDEWSAMQTLRHIRDAIQVYGMRFKWMILQVEPFLPNYEENLWATHSPDGPANVAQILEEISAYRGETVRLLRGLPDDGWGRIGRHEMNGPIELEPYVRHELVHEEMHLEQLKRALSSS
jgi:hypothetical protein